MIKTTISKTKNKNNLLAQYKKIAEGTSFDKKVVQNIVLDNYKLLASGFCFDKKCDDIDDNVILFEKKQKVA